MVKKNRILGRQKKDYSDDGEKAVSIMIQEKVRETETIFNYNSLDISSIDKETLISLEKDMIFQGKRLGDIGYIIGSNLEKAREIFKKYSTVEGDPESFVGWYQSMGLNKDQVYLFRGRYKLCLQQPSYRENILALSDRAVKEVITKNTPAQILEKVLKGDLKTGKDIKRAKEEFKISSVLEIEKNEEENIKRKEKEILLLKKDIKERENIIKNLYAQLSNLEKELKELKK